MKIICFLSFLFAFHLANAQSNREIVVAAAYAIDANSTWDVKDVPKKAALAFKEKETVNVGYGEHTTVWCRFKIRNTNLSKAIETWLCFDNYHIDSLRFFDGPHLELMGDRTTNPGPFLKSLAYQVRLRANEEKILLVSIKKQTSYLDFSFHFDHSTALADKSSKKIALVAFFVGIAFLLLMVNGILFFLTKNNVHAYYINYSLLTVLYVLISSNFAKHILFPQLLWFSEGRVFVGALWYIALSYFLSCFLKLRFHQYGKYKLIKTLGQINLFLILLSIILLFIYPKFDFRYLFISGYAVFMLSIVALFWAAIVHLKIERQQAIYALLAFAPQLIWGAVLILKTFEILPLSLGDDWMIFASLYEVFLFGFVLSRNYIDVFIKNNELMHEVIMEKEHSLRAIGAVQLRERRNIANIIHDKVGSKIAHIVHLFDMKNPKLAKQNIIELASEIRDLSHRILPKALDEGALVSSLRSQLGVLNDGLPDAEIELFAYDFPERIEESWIYDLYLITLEVVNNAIKHGRANLITIEFYRYPTNYHFQFTDNGQGFDTGHTEMGFGLDNIKRRIDFYKGSFEISSFLGQGTIIQIDLPLPS